jgi:hypothetical protein
MSSKERKKRGLNGPDESLQQKMIMAGFARAPLVFDAGKESVEICELRDIARGEEEGWDN